MRFDEFVAEARRDLAAWDAIPEARLRALADKLDPPEVTELLISLDQLSASFDAVPDWDGDERDSISAAQAAWSQVIGFLKPSLQPEADKGLASPWPRSRKWVVLGLEAHGARAKPALERAWAKECDARLRGFIADAISRLGPN